MVYQSNRRNDRSWGRSAKFEVDDNCLVELQKKAAFHCVNGGHFEITINLPRTPSFTSMLSSRQKCLYGHLWDSIKNVITISGENDYTFEFCKSGHVHLHAIMKIPKSCKLIPVGGISDIVKQFINTYNRVYSNEKAKNKLRYNERSMWFMENVYKSPAICVRYRGENEAARLVYWTDYMHKCALKTDN